MFKNSASKAFEYVNTAKQVASSLGFFSKSSSAAATKAPVAAITAPPIANTSAASWTKWAVPAAYGVGGLLVSGAAAGAAYYKRDDLGMGYKWATDHMKYVGTLWDEKSLKKRLEQLVEIENNLGVTFREYVISIFPVAILTQDSSVTIRFSLLSLHNTRSLEHSQSCPLRTHLCANISCLSRIIWQRMRYLLTLVCLRLAKTIHIMG